MVRHHRLVLILTTLLSMAGCAYHPQDNLPPTELPALELATATAPQLDQPLSGWWRQYQSAELNDLMQELDLNNLELASARERITKARALLGQQQAVDVPAVNGQINHRTNHDVDNAITDHQNNLGFSASYEVDLWGARSAARYGAEMNLIAQQQEYRSILLQLQATLVQQYFDFLALRERHELAVQNLQASKDLLDLIQARFDAGSASGIELNQQRNTYLATQATLLETRRALVTRERALAILLGRQSIATAELVQPFSSLAYPQIRSIQPAALLEYRPDIQLAASQLQISEAALYQEEMKRWPTLNLSAGLSLQDILQASEGWTSALITALAMPLYDGGKISQQIKAAESDKSLARLNYRQTVLQAMQETLETLTELTFQQDLLSVREKELDNNQHLYDLARLRYDAGDTDFINLLTAQRSWFNARDSLIQTRNTRLQATVNLFRAMGVAPETEKVSESL